MPLGSSTGTRPASADASPASRSRKISHDSAHSKSPDPSSPPTKTNIPILQTSQRTASANRKTSSTDKHLRIRNPTDELPSTMSGDSYSKVMSSPPANPERSRSRSRSPESLLGSEIPELGKLRKNESSQKLLNSRDSLELARQSKMVSNVAKKVRSEAESDRITGKPRRSERKKTTKDSGARKKATETAVTPKQQSRLMLVNEEVTQSGLVGASGTKGPLANGKVFGLVFFKGQAGSPADVRAVKDVRRKKKDTTDKKGKEKNTKSKNSKKVQKSKEERSKRHHSENRATKKREAKHKRNMSDLGAEMATGSLDKHRADHKDKSSNKLKRSKSMYEKTLCKVEVDNKNKSTLVVKLRTKRSK